MMYQNKFVVCVKVDGKVVRERGDKVYLPFGCEYTILLKNLNSHRAVVSVEIDEKDVCDGSQLVIPAHGETELKGSMKGGQGYRAFRFIEKTQEISDHRGDRRKPEGHWDRC